MTHVIVRSKRLLTRFKRADKAMREARHLLVKDGSINGRNSDRFMSFLLSWMRATGLEKYKRPSAPREPREA